MSGLFHFGFFLGTPALQRDCGQTLNATCPIRRPFVRVAPILAAQLGVVPIHDAKQLYQ